MSNHGRHRPKFAVNSTLGRIGQGRGKETEDRVFAVFTNPGVAKPDWFVSMIRASKEQDQHGIDAVVRTTDIGELFLQIKSSFSAKRDFERRTDLKYVAVAAVRFYESDERIATIVIRELEALRERLRPQAQAIERLG